MCCSTSCATPPGWVRRSWYGHSNRWVTITCFARTAATATAASPTITSPPARGGKGIDRVLAEAGKTFGELPEGRRWEFDEESLTNPFSDTRILVGDPQTDVRSLLVGIDIGVGEILL